MCRGRDSPRRAVHRLAGGSADVGRGRDEGDVDVRSCNSGGQEIWIPRPGLRAAVPLMRGHAWYDGVLVVQHRGARQSSGPLRDAAVSVGLPGGAGARAMRGRQAARGTFTRVPVAHLLSGAETGARAAVIAALQTPASLAPPARFIGLAAPADPRVSPLGLIRATRISLTSSSPRAIPANFVPPTEAPAVHYGRLPAPPMPSSRRTIAVIRRHRATIRVTASRCSSARLSICSSCDSARMAASGLFNECWRPMATSPAARSWRVRCT